jgi:hypothetical protein
MKRASRVTAGPFSVLAKINPTPVIPAQAGTQRKDKSREATLFVELGPGLRRDDGIGD